MDYNGARLASIAWDIIELIGSQELNPAQITEVLAQVKSHDFDN